MGFDATGIVKVAYAAVVALAASACAFGNDYIESWWKSMYAPEWVSEQHGAQDDFDRDGWGAWNERRAGTLPSATASISPKGTVVAERPSPWNEFTLFGEISDGSFAQLAIATYNDVDLRKCEVRTFPGGVKTVDVSLS